MASEVRVPTTGNAGEDAVLVEWAVAVGDTVSAGQILVTLETAKAALEVESPADGVVLRLDAEPGDEVAEHAVIALVGAQGEAVDAAPSAATPAPAAAEVPTATAAPTPTTPAGTADSERIAASPRARIIAERRGLSLVGITGSGPNGRIIVADVLRAADAAPAAAPTAAPATAALVTSSPAPAAEFEVVPVRGARKVTAERMHASLSEAAQVTLTRYADATAMLAYLARVRQVTESRGQRRIGVNDAVLFAVARTLPAHPEANATFAWDGIRRYRSVNLGFAVDNGSALYVPVIRNADSMALPQIAEASSAAIDKARAGKLTADDMSDGTFTISNLGSLGVHWFTPVLNAPQVGILGVGAAHRAYPDAPAQLPLSLTFDHRALDGAAAARLLAGIAEAIENLDVIVALGA